MTEEQRVIFAAKRNATIEAKILKKHAQGLELAVPVTPEAEIKSVLAATRAETETEVVAVEPERLIRENERLKCGREEANLRAELIRVNNEFAREREELRRENNILQDKLDRFMKSMSDMGVEWNSARQECDVLKRENAELKRRLVVMQK